VRPLIRIPFSSTSSTRNNKESVVVLTMAHKVLSEGRKRSVTQRQSNVKGWPAESGEMDIPVSSPQSRMSCDNWTPWSQIPVNDNFALCLHTFWNRGSRSIRSPPFPTSLEIIWKGWRRK
jgi:hypothetical protein